MLSRRCLNHTPHIPSGIPLRSLQCEDTLRCNSGLLHKLDNHLSLAHHKRHRFESNLAYLPIHPKVLYHTYAQPTPVLRIAAVQDDIRDIAEEYLKKFEYYHLFETPNMNWLSEKIAPMGYGICFMAEYYLPKTEMLSGLACDYELKVLEQKDFDGLYLPEWSNALCEDRRELDVLGVGAYDDDKLIGLAGCSADCDEMWQIGVDVLPEYRRNGIASAITSRLTSEIIKRDKVPFYCTAWSNVRSVRNAIKCGLIPSWVEMTIKPVSVIEDMNKGE